MTPTDTLFERLEQACAEEWKAYVDHEFVRLIGYGTLPEASFRFYLEQDYLFLIQFARAWALAVYKSETLDEMRAAASLLNAILETEMALHVKYCQGWGLTEKEMEAKEEARANMAYTRYVLERGLSGDLLDLHVALAPCVVGYAEIGSRLLNDTQVNLEGNPYREWIETYGSEEYQQVARSEIERLDVLAENRMGTGRFEGLARTFRQATRLEIGFWEMGLERET
jgi:thiaminase/transcriptional activator TenA